MKNVKFTDADTGESITIKMQDHEINNEWQNDEYRKLRDWLTGRILTREVIEIERTNN